jgi:hypothetical protein
VRGCCDARGIATEGLRREMQIEREPDGRRISRRALDIHWLKVRLFARLSLR